jgi:uncharacterized membrane protein
MTTPSLPDVFRRVSQEPMSKKTPRRRQATTQPPRDGRPSSRYAIIDALRGVALLAMFAYHFCFDLNYFGVLRQNFNVDSFWLTARTSILSSFLLLVGISLALATQRGILWRGYWRRLGLVAGCALLVSAGSYAMFRNSWIFFGVLHHIALASLLGLAFLRFDWANLPIGLALILLGAFVKLPAFDAPALQWIGLMTHKPITEDYVPLLPWFGIVLLGIFAGRRFMDQNSFAPVRTWTPAGYLTRLLGFAGRHSLILYMLHQPIFIGLLHIVLRR